MVLRLDERWGRRSRRELFGFLGMTVAMVCLFLFGLAINDELPVAVRAIGAGMAGIMLVVALAVLISRVRTRGSAPAESPR